jgi:hypothetical protein
MYEREWFMTVPLARPSVFLVRWQDEEAGWKQLQVIAANEGEAVETIGNVVGTHANMRAYPCP